LYEVAAVDYSCAKADAYITRFIRVVLPHRKAGEQNRLYGPSGFTCTAFPDKNGRAYGGLCTRKFAVFYWNYNVLGLANPPMETIAANMILRTLDKGHYELVVQNESNIGFIDGFTWKPGHNLRINALLSVRGDGPCQLTTDKTVSCAGRLRPPQCLCTPNGGSVTIDFTATGDNATKANGYLVNHGVDISHLHITAMTPVPYWIPDAQTSPGHSHV
jgi:hypothetical protein